ncbi:MAG TPA: efflux RND transporter permease subunit, partial [Bacillota bacterium]|nr:efflux RND transporter permease subunit [Bacillota bacterium]
MKLTEVCIKRPVTTGMFYLALLVLGVISSSLMPIDLFPEVTYPAINIRTTYSGAGPEEIERLITIPIEQSVSTINGVKSIMATSQEGSSRVTVNFDWGYDLDEAANDIRANLDRTRRRLPDEADTPTIFKFDPSMSPVLTLGLSGQQDEAALRKLADDDLSYLLQRIDGVAQVEVRGGKNQEIRVFLKQDRMQAFGITANQLTSAIAKENSMTPAGYLEVGIGDYLLRTKGELQTLDEIRNLVVAQRDGIPVYLKDLADIEQGYETTRSLTRIDGRPGIVLSISKRSGANTVAVADRLYKVLDEIKKTHPDLNLRILNDGSTYIREAVGSVSDSAVQGALLAALILLLFFHNIRVTVITGITIPVSIVITLILAYFCKMTLNTISLGGLALGVGMLLDNSIVILDNIYQHNQRNGGNIKAAAIEGTAEMGPALLSSTLTSVCVFFPLIFLTGRNGIIFKELSFMVIFSQLVSLGVAITLIPLLCARYLKVQDLEEIEGRSLKGRLVKMQHSWEQSYSGMLKWCLGHKKTIMLGGLGLFLVSLVLFPFVGTELVQNTDEGVISVNLQLPTGTRLEETDRVMLGLEQLIRKDLPELANMEVSVGGGNSYQGSLTLRLKPKEESERNTQAVVDYLKDKLVVPGARLRIRMRNSMRLLYGGSQTPIEIDIRGYDQQQSRKVATDIMDTISEIPGIINVEMSREEERPELDIMIDRKRAADYGVTAAQITEAVQINMEGKVATTLRKNGEEVQVRVNLQESDRKSWKDLGRIMVSGSNNRVVPLSSLVHWIQTDSPVGIERKDQERNVTVSAGLDKRDLAGAIHDIQQAVGKLPLPDGIKVFYAGDFEEQQKSAKEFQTVIILALLLVYMVMAAQFESFFDPLVIMFSVPFALSGVILMLLLTDTLFNTQVYLGLVLLGGVVVNNAIVLISYIRILLDQGMKLEKAVVEGARSRLRPVLITTLTTILGLVPMALGFGEGAETQVPLARTVIGGMAFSTLLTLLLIPVIFTALESRLSQVKNRFRKSGAVAALIMLILLITVATPVRTDAAARKLSVSEAVSLALQNNEDGKIFLKKREYAEAAYRETMGEKGLQFFFALDSENVGQGDQSTEVSLNVEKSAPVVNLFGVKSLSDKVADYNRVSTIYNIEWQEQQFIYKVIEAFQSELLAKRDFQLAEE